MDVACGRLAAGAGAQIAFQSSPAVGINDLQRLEELDDLVLLACVQVLERGPRIHRLAVVRERRIPERRELAVVKIRPFVRSTPELLGQELGIAAEELR
jgi:hypothetical protein